MNDINPAVLDNLRELFDHVDRVSNGTAPAEKFDRKEIDTKDFIALCNLCEAQSKDSSGDSEAKTLGSAVESLNQLDSSELDAMESALKEGRWAEWRKDSGKKVLEEDAVFYLELKRRTDNQRHYHFNFDVNAVAEIDAFDPFFKVENGKQVLNQQWHALISLLAFLDVAHALSNEQHEYHCLYKYIERWDRNDLNALKLRLRPSASGDIKLQRKPKDEQWRSVPSKKMNEWLIEALRKLAGK